MDRVEVFDLRVGCTDIGAIRISFLLLLLRFFVLEFNTSLLSSSSSSSSPTSYSLFLWFFVFDWLWVVFVYIIWVECCLIEWGFWLVFGNRENNWSNKIGRLANGLCFIYINIRTACQFHLSHLCGWCQWIRTRIQWRCCGHSPFQLQWGAIEGECAWYLNI